MRRRLVLRGWLLAAALSGCGGREDASAPAAAPEPVAPVAAPAPEPELVVSSSASDTERADARFGVPSGDGAHELAPLPPLRWGEASDPGSPLHPAVFLELPASARGAQLAAAYRRVYEELDGMNGWMPLAETPAGWRDFVTGRDVVEARRIACGIDLLEAVRLEADVDVGVRELAAGCRRLHELLGGELGPPLDERAVRDAGARMARALETHGVLRLRFRAPDGFAMRDVHGTARALGFQRSDFGTYAWYNAQDVGHDRLLVIDPGVHPDHADGADARTPDVVLTIELSSVPVPEIVGERMWQTARALERALGVAPRWAVLGEPDGDVPDEASFRARIERSITALRAAGFFRDVVRADEPPR